MSSSVADQFRREFDTLLIQSGQFITAESLAFREKWAVRLQPTEVSAQIPQQAFPFNLLGVPQQAPPVQQQVPLVPQQAPALNPLEGFPFNMIADNMYNLVGSVAQQALFPQQPTSAQQAPAPGFPFNMVAENLSSFIASVAQQATAAPASPAPVPPPAPAQSSLNFLAGSVAPMLVQTASNLIQKQFQDASVGQLSDKLDGIRRDMNQLQKEMSKNESTVNPTSGREDKRDTTQGVPSSQRPQTAPSSQRPQGDAAPPLPVVFLSALLRGIEDSMRVEDKTDNRQ